MKNTFVPFSRLFYVFLVVSGLCMTIGCQHRAASPFSAAAEKALSTFQLPPGFKIELVAAEPLISDPVDMSIDENGYMYVVEMHGYPLDLHHSGKVIRLTDTDGDGKMDKRTVFAEGLTLPTGVMRWKKGVIVTDAPDVYYLEDTTGDGKADIRKVMLTGFALTNPQYLVNRPLYGLDNWIYLAHEGIEETEQYPKEFGDTGHAIFYPGYPEGPRLPANAGGHTVRFRPDTHGLEATSSSTQFGQTFDEWGHHFLVSNADHIYQEVIASRYLERNPNQLVGDATASLSDHGDACEVFPVTRNPENQLLTDVGVITSACGITDYLGGAFPPPFDHDVTFVCEPVSNLVHVDRLRDKGASFTAGRVLEREEFLASTDAWFRPVNMYIGPDGALYIVDYYRRVIEHPEWMSAGAVKSGDLYAGRDMGRIYRISAKNAPPVIQARSPKLSDATDEQLVQELTNPNIWWRRNAQRLLVDRNHAGAVPALIRMAQDARFPLGRLHALWTLEGMGRLSPELILQALRDPVSGVRENAVKLAEFHLEHSPALVAALPALKGDSSAKVRYQLLCTLGSVNTPDAKRARSELLFRDIDDKWVQIAALSAASLQSDSILVGLLAQFDPGIPAYASLIRRLGAMTGAMQDAETIRHFLHKAVRPLTTRESGWQAPLLEGLAEGLKSRSPLPPGLRAEQNLLISTCFRHPSVEVRESARHALQAIGLPHGTQEQALMQEAVCVAGNSALSPEKRAEALHLLALTDPGAYVPFLERLITPRTPLMIQLAALQAVSAIPDTTVSSFVLKQWPALTPEVRDAALQTFITEPFNVQRIGLLLDAVENGKIQQGALDWSLTVILMRDIPDTLKERARALLTGKDENRASVIRRYKEALRLQGDPARGEAVFRSDCIICHQLRGAMGIAFGPDLGTVHNWSPESIMINILDPDLSIAHGYDMWEVMLNDGTSRQGIIPAETPAAIVLRSEGGRETTIARRDIRSLRTLGRSAMPPGFEKKIDKQQMADLLAFLRQNK